MLRVFLPSLITLFGRAGETPPELMGAYAAAWFLLPFLAALLRPSWCLYGGAALLVVSRLLLQTGLEQLYTASAGVSAGLVFLYGCARTLDRRAVPLGLAAGLAATVVTHQVLDQVDLVWRDEVPAWLGVVALCAGFAVALREARPSHDLAPSATWALFGPALFLVGQSHLVPLPPAWAPGMWGEVLARGVVGLSAVLLLLAAALPRWPGWALVGMVGVLLVVGTGLPDASLASPMIGAAIGIALSATALRRPPPRRPGAALLGGTTGFLVATFVYYAAYDLDLGFPNRLVPLVMGLTVVAALALTARGTDRPFHPPLPPAPGADPLLPPTPGAVHDAGSTPPPPLGSPSSASPARQRLVAAAVLAVIAVVGATGVRVDPAVQRKTGDQFTLLAYNIRMGFGLDGRLSLDRIAAFINERSPDVVLLSEVDRGWLLNGGHDDLGRIARLTGLRHVFAPAADERWGDALLTNLPVTVRSHRLGRHDYPTGAQAQAIVVEVGGREVGIVNTHLQAPGGQAPEVARIAGELARGLDLDSMRSTEDGMPARAAVVGDPRPVVLAGDLNIPAGDPGLAPLLDAGLRDPLTNLGNPLTSPADAPVKRIDHVLVTQGIEVLKAEVPRLPYSDHLPVLATLRLTSVDQGG
ncbi:endonuclease/exonuclease/phosphatase family protein [Nonomuraea soli]|uniref:Endonuclease/exonuclease/phosphatase family metal-dependent hydrolase n=1 Tax=Nonomuraea soli TaxID=1032476 RepID=A0A7W0CD26_9ACTN|nr:endonuclease/exonuclease/phosphatase family protein [Nonomuraea soli]MBA2888928.1 endonuclease/exonuclease/phosphatase family metal-dependent hydrolase [Nonomuraea soli]